MLTKTKTALLLALIGFSGVPSDSLAAVDTLISCETAQQMVQATHQSTDRLRVTFNRQREIARIISEAPLPAPDFTALRMEFKQLGQTGQKILLETEFKRAGDQPVSLFFKDLTLQVSRLNARGATIWKAFSRSINEIPGGRFGGYVATLRSNDVLRMGSKISTTFARPEHPMSKSTLTVNGSQFTGFLPDGVSFIDSRNSALAIQNLVYLSPIGKDVQVNVEPLTVGFVINRSELSFDDENFQINGVKIPLEKGMALVEVAAKINAVSAMTGVTAFDGGRSLHLGVNDGRNLSVFAHSLFGHTDRLILYRVGGIQEDVSGFWNLRRGHWNTFYSNFSLQTKVGMPLNVAWNGKTIAARTDECSPSFSDMLAPTYRTYLSVGDDFSNRSLCRAVVRDRSSAKTSMAVLSEAIRVIDENKFPFWPQVEAYCAN